MFLRRVVKLTIASAFFLAACAVWAADASIGGIALPTPEGWRVGPDPDAPAEAPTLLFRTQEGEDFMMLVTPWPKTFEGEKIDLPKARQVMEFAAMQTRSASVEKELPVLELNSDTVKGYYFSATDRAPRPGEYTYLIRGLILVGDRPISFTILSNGKENLAPAKALEVLRFAHAQ